MYKSVPSPLDVNGSTVDFKYCTLAELSGKLVSGTTNLDRPSGSGESTSAWVQTVV